MLKYKSVLSLFIIASFIFSSCATIFKGSTDEVNISSDPSGAKIYINGQYMGETPMPIELKSNKSYTIEFRKNGYENKTVLVNNEIGAGWIVLDVIFGIVPVIIDAATGNWHYLTPENVTAALEEQSVGSK